MADPTSFRPSRTRLRWLRATGLVVVLGALVPPSSWAAEALGLRQSVAEYQRFQDWSTPISEVMVNAGDTWIEVVRSEGVSGKGVVWLERSCVLPSPSPPWWEVSAGGLEDLGLVLQKKNHRPAQADDIEGLIGLVQDENLGIQYRAIHELVAF